MAKSKKTAVDIYWVDGDHLCAKNVCNTVSQILEVQKTKFPKISNEIVSNFKENITHFFEIVDRDSDAYIDGHFKVFYVRNYNVDSNDAHYNKYLMSIQIFN